MELWKILPLGSDLAAKAQGDFVLLSRFEVRFALHTRNSTWRNRGPLLANRGATKWPVKLPIGCGARATV
jgi:hypothetical protein